MNNKIHQYEEKNKKREQQILEIPEAIKYIQSFERYYESCEEYTFNRVEDIEKRINIITQNIDVKPLKKSPLDIAFEIKELVFNVVSKCYVDLMNSRVMQTNQIHQLQNEMDGMTCKISSLEEKLFELHKTKI